MSQCDAVIKRRFRSVFLLHDDGGGGSGGGGGVRQRDEDPLRIRTSIGPNEDLMKTRPTENQNKPHKGIEPAESPATQIDPWTAESHRVYACVRA